MNVTILPHYSLTFLSHFGPGCVGVYFLPEGDVSNSENLSSQVITYITLTRTMGIDLFKTTKSYTDLAIFGILMNYSYV